ncbi:MAG: acyl carrier protein [Candidatus Sericytochromatia bacterium]|nr:acyl carrier protein [Candidatus Sericytochromatia bacterium]
MIIAGDSNISTFSRGCIIPEKNNEEVKISWLGPLNSSFFIDNHPSAIKLIEVFNLEQDWKILSIGTFEVFKIFHEIKSGKPKEALLLETSHLYTRIFSQLNTKGKFAWMVGMQQIKYDIYENALAISLKKIREYSREEKLPLINLANEFNQVISNICHKLSIPIINPLPKLVAQDGILKEEYLSEDKMHINSLYDQFYYDEIKKSLGITLIRKGFIESDIFGSDGHSLGSEMAKYVKFDNKTFFNMFFKALNIPELIDQRNLVSIKQELIKIINKKISDRGDSIQIDMDTDVVNDGLLDSFDLLETYTEILDLLDLKIDFQINLYYLNSINKLADYIFKYYGQKLTKRDFFVSFQGNFDIPEQKDLIIESESKIAKMDFLVFQIFNSLIKVSSPNKKIEFGFMFLWLALHQSELKNYRKAIQLIQSSREVNIMNPIKDGRVNYYLQKWFKLL